LIRGFTFWDIEKIKSDAGTEFTSQEFEQFCADKRVAISFLPQKIRRGTTWQKGLGNL
jgi:transposase InsO family protein